MRPIQREAGKELQEIIPKTTVQLTLKCQLPLKARCSSLDIIDRHHSILMLDRDHIIVSNHAQSADQILEGFGIVTIANAAEGPCPASCQQGIPTWFHC